MAAKISLRFRVSPTGIWSWKGIRQNYWMDCSYNRKLRRGLMTVAEVRAEILSRGHEIVAYDPNDTVKVLGYLDLASGRFYANERGTR